MYDQQAELERSNTYLEKAIEAYLNVFQLDDVPEGLQLIAGRQCAQRQSFRGNKLFSSVSKNASL